MSEWFVNQRMRDGWEGSEIKAGDQGQVFRMEESGQGEEGFILIKHTWANQGGEDAWA